MGKRKRLFTASVLLVTAAWGAFLAFDHDAGARASPAATAGGPTPLPEVPVAAVEVRRLAPSVIRTGSLDAVERVPLRARVPGMIDAITMQEGGDVREGQVLFRLDPRPYRIALDRARAGLRDALAHRVLVEQQLGRARALDADAVLAASELEVSEASVGRAHASVQAARAEVRARALDLSFTRIVAPISGRVAESAVERGSLVSGGSDASTLLTEIVALDPLHVVFDVDEPTYHALTASARDADGRVRGRTVRLALGGEDAFAHEAELDYLAPAVDADTGTARARAVLSNADARFSPGMFVRISVPLGAPRDMVLVPESSVHTDATGRYVLVVRADGVVDARSVQLGATVEGLRIVERGVARTDRVVTAGMVRPGTRVRPRLVPTPSRSTSNTDGSTP